MTTRQTIAALLSTTAIAFSITIPALAANPADIVTAVSRMPVGGYHDTLGRHVEEVLAADPTLGRFGLVASSRDGLVRVAGTVTSEVLRRRAAQQALEVTGVREVVNEVVVAPA